MYVNINNKNNELYELHELYELKKEEIREITREIRLNSLFKERHFCLAEVYSFTVSSSMTRTLGKLQMKIKNSR